VFKFFKEPLNDVINIIGAREHNLKNISVSIPRGKLVVITGISGSGKSTLAFDILFSEGQRRFLDSINAYARQFVEQLPKPDVDYIDGLPPTVSIEQRTSRGGGKSTVATVTEIYHFLRLLFSKVGVQYCPDCNLRVGSQTIENIDSNLMKLINNRGQLTLLAPKVKGRKGYHWGIIKWASENDFPKIRLDGKIKDINQEIIISRHQEHSIEIVTGTLDKDGYHKFGSIPVGSRLDFIRMNLDIGNGVFYAMDRRGKIFTFSIANTCPSCGKSFEQPDPKMFSYNSPTGWCPRCRGFGEIFYLPDVDRGPRAEQIEESWFEWMEGEREICPECDGARINRVARFVRLEVERKNRVRLHNNDKDEYPSIVDFSKSTVETVLKFFSWYTPTGRAGEIAKDIIPEIRERLRFLNEVGLGYLELGRGVPTLSGGEAQRIRLAAQLGSNLWGVLYVLDEPTIGLHPRDNDRLLECLKKMRDRGNSVVVVEHDLDTIRNADFIIDLGPGAGGEGGEIIASGTLDEILLNENSITAQCLKASRRYPSRGSRRPVKTNRKTEPHNWLVLENANLHNLKNLTVKFPLGRFIVVTGVSGSGKSTLIRECLYAALKSVLENQSPPHGLRLHGYETIKAVYEVDQSPIGKTPRSIPATYIGFFDEIRKLFSKVPEARLRGYLPGRFSFNSEQGKCPDCNGVGMIKVEMSFLPTAYTQCPTCKGSRFNSETLDIEYNGKNIAEVLDMTVSEALEFFKAIPTIHQPLKILQDTGLGYLKLGQQSPTLSGGEAQRIKLVYHLLSGLKNAEEDKIADSNVGQKYKRKTKLFILEEPTIGLHSADVGKLVDVLQRLVDYGHTVIVIEHNLELIAEADWVIDLGPEGGDKGGKIVGAGTPETIAKLKNSLTGHYLKKLLKL
jgi:excinuclease ABC subunit A